MADISIVFATRSTPQKLEEMFENVCWSCQDSNRLELVVKIDRNDAALLKYWESGVWRRFGGLKIGFVITDQNGGYFNLGPAYNQLLLATDPNSYFIMVGNDDLRFAHKDWDTLMLTYKHQWPDDIVYIRTSLHKDIVYNNDTWLMLTKPDNFAFFSRKLMHMMEGVGDYWSSDTWFGPIVGLLEDRFGKKRAILWPGDLFTSPSMMWSGKPAADQTKIMAAFHRMNQPEYMKYSFERIAKKISDYIDNFKG